MRQNKLEKLYHFKPDKVNDVLKCLGALLTRYQSFQKCQQNEFLSKMNKSGQN